jgi:hypothetical protein
MERKKVIIDGCDMGSLQIGERAKVFVNGQVLLTSAVVNKVVAGGHVYIETKNTIYASK